MVERAHDSVREHGVVRLPFLDGLRGIAALIVAIGHMVFLVPSVSSPGLATAGLVDVMLWPARFGTQMVFLFLLVSGFSLYYSERTRTARGRPPTTLRQFVLRRWWRIAPVYYVALALGIGTVLLLPPFELRPENQTALQLDVAGIASHLVFLHNLRPEWLYQGNAPLWSIAYEAQLYALFPLLFVTMRCYPPLLVALAVVTAVKAVSLLGLGFPVFGLARWFVAGCLLAELIVRGTRLPLRLTLPIGLIALLIGMLQLPVLQPELRHDAVWVLAFSALILAMAAVPYSSKNPANWSWVRWLGERSYSLYALHFPVTLVAIWASLAMGLRGHVASLAVTAVALPGSLILTVLVFRWIEVPSLAKVASVR